RHPAWEADVLPLNYARSRRQIRLDYSGCGGSASKLPLPSITFRADHCATSCSLSKLLHHENSLPSSCYPSRATCYSPRSTVTQTRRSRFHGSQLPIQVRRCSFCTEPALRNLRLS